MIVMVLLGHKTLFVETLSLTTLHSNFHNNYFQNSLFILYKESCSEYVYRYNYTINVHIYWLSSSIHYMHSYINSIPIFPIKLISILSFTQYLKCTCLKTVCQMCKYNTKSVFMACRAIPYDCYFTGLNFYRCLSYI